MLGRVVSGPTQLSGPTPKIRKEETIFWAEIGPAMLSPHVLIIFN